MAERSGDNGEAYDAGLAEVVRLLDERTPGDERTCIRCLGPVPRETYEATGFVCGRATPNWETYPWRSSHGGSTP